MGFLNKPIGWILNLCYKVVPNYAVALLIFAFVMKLVLFPLGIKQQKNTVKQASLRPKEMAIRNHYAGRTDKATQQKMNEEIMNLYQKENFNPAGGCLPMLLQLVIVFALYGVINAPLQYVTNLDKTTISNIGIETVIAYYDNDETTLDVSKLTESEKKALDAYKDKIKYNEDGTIKVKEEDGVKTIEGVSNPFIQVDLIRLLRNQEDISIFTGTSKLTGAELLPEGFEKEDLPNFMLFGNSFDLSQTPSFGLNWTILLPILTFVFTYGSMKLTRKFTYQPVAQPSGDAGLSMKIMDFMMPLMSTFFTFSVPAVIAVYWIYQNVFSTLQQMALKLMYPYPTFTEEDYKEAEREMYKGVKLKKAGKKSAKRAAHRIDLDEEDDVETNQLPLKKESKGSGFIPPAALKDESDKELPPSAEDEKTDDEPQE
jgi:YidC/Oxa1 family membrane protein insertase